MLLRWLIPLDFDRTDGIRLGLHDRHRVHLTLVSRLNISSSFFLKKISISIFHPPQTERLYTGTASDEEK